MRSIRRSLLGYFMLLLALALSAVGVLVDRFADDAIKHREKAEAERIGKAYELRRSEAKVKFDAELLTETKSLARELNPKIGLLLGQWPGRGAPKGPPDGLRPEIPNRPDLTFQASPKEVQEFRTRLTALALGQIGSSWQRVATAGIIEPPAIPNQRPGGGPREWLRPLTPLWDGFEAPLVLAKIQDSLRKLFDDEEHQGYYQFHLIATVPGQPGRISAVVRSARFGHDVPFEIENLERTADTEYLHDDVEIPGRGTFRRVVKVGGRPSLAFPLWVTPPPAITFSRLAPRAPDLFIRVVVHHARPYSELEARLAEEQRNGDAELAHVRDETRKELTELRTNLSLIGLGSFAALALGGWLIVARGLSPIHKLSDAVSRVSEKDFRLPVERGELSRELQPILARLTSTLDSLRRAFEREKQAVGDISHELRTPIASLLATIDVSLRKMRSPEQYRATLEDCRGIARQLGQLVERIMTLASLDAGNARTTLSRIDAADLLADCAAIIRPLAEAHDLTFEHDASGPLELDTDPDKLREVFMNLLHNAVEYNRAGGRVELSASHRASQIVFEIRDTGIGMPPGVRERIFERFFRADASRHATGVHAGLGLAIVKEYVERLSGAITFESTPDVGTTFRVAMPAAPVASAADSDDLSPIAEDVHSEFRRRGEPASAGS